MSFHVYNQTVCDTYWISSAGFVM